MESDARPGPPNIEHVDIEHVDALQRGQPEKSRGRRGTLGAALVVLLSAAFGYWSLRTHQVSGKFVPYWEMDKTIIPIHPWPIKMMAWPSWDSPAGAWSVRLGTENIWIVEPFRFKSDMYRFASTSVDGVYLNLGGGAPILGTMLPMNTMSFIVAPGRFVKNWFAEEKSYRTDRANYPDILEF